MILDNEEQRKTLLGLLRAVPIKGTLGELLTEVPKLNVLLNAIRDADVAEAAKNGADGE